MASVFPITIEKLSLKYERGTSNKEYHLLQLTTADKRALLVKRWGKTGSWGQQDVLTGFAAKMTTEFRSKMSEKARGGYEEQHRTKVEVHNEADFRKKLGDPYFHKLGKELDFLGMKAGAAPATLESDDYEEPTAPATVAAPPKSDAERYAKNKLWGAF